MDGQNTLRDSAERLRTQATVQLHGVARDGKDRISALLGGLVLAAHEIADRLGDDDASPVARYTRKAAASVDEVSSSLRDRSVEELVEDGRAIVRKSPAIAIGVAVAAGFVLSRFLGATAPAEARRPARFLAGPDA